MLNKMTNHQLSA